MTKRTTLALAKVYARLPSDIRRTIVITGSPRSGTTWLAEMVATLPGSAVLWEPCHIANMPAARDAGMTWRTELGPQDDAPAIEAYMQRVLSGRALTWWTARLLTGYSPTRTWIVKFVRANRMLGWLTTRFDTRRPLLLIRHPCATVSSQLEWGFDAGGLPPEQDFVSRNPELRGVYEGLSTPEERLAFVWAADVYVPLTSPERHRWDVVLYEELVRNPMSEMTRIFRRWGLEPPPNLASRTRKASDTVSARRSGDISGATMTSWRDRISDGQAGRILAVTRAFGLDFYGPEPDPDLAHPLLREPVPTT